MNIAEALKRFRAEFTLPQKEVAENLGMVPQAYSRYESGKFIPRADDIVKLAKMYNVSTDYLLGLSDSPRPSGFDENQVRQAQEFRALLKSFVEDNGI